MVRTSRVDLHDARAHAERVAAGARLEITELGGGDVACCQELIQAVWGPDQVLAEPLLRALAHAGTSLLGAMRDGQCIGTSVGFLGWSGGPHLWSHITAVHPDHAGRGVGFALKTWQRLVCLEHGINEIRWTYDPLIARNAYFNLVKLGARVRRFLPDHYGVMTDDVNADDHSDRFEVTWRLDDPLVVRTLAGSPPTVEERGRAFAIPADYERLRREEPDESRRLRRASRELFTTLEATRRRPHWSADTGAYILVPESRDTGE
jgi:predicted GNAT superfamily acetyltransferase